jgi:20S proteasome alpha/beta subunit
MTVCIGAISYDKNYGKNFAVIASDRMVTLGTPKLEIEQIPSKTLKVTDYCVVATSGSANIFSDIYRTIKQSLTEHDPGNVVAIAEDFRRSYAHCRINKVEENILTSMGIMNMPEFESRSQSLPSKIVDQLKEDIKNYDLGFKMMLAGVDGDGAHIFEMNNPGATTSYEDLGYCAIGAGEIHAITFMADNGYHPGLDLVHVLSLVYAAKKKSEKATGVGTATDIYIAGQDSAIKLCDEDLKELDQMYTNRESRMREEIMKDVNMLVEKMKLENRLSMRKDIDNSDINGNVV